MYFAPTGQRDANPTPGCNCPTLGTFASEHPWMTFFLASSLITGVATTIQVAVRPAPAPQPRLLP